MRVLNIFIGISALLSSCQDTKTVPKNTPKLEEKESTIPTQKVDIPTSKLKRTPRITNKIVTNFYEAYGKNNPEQYIRINTNLGDIDIQLYNDTPIHRANFIHIIKRGFLNETCFYRVSKDFVIQGGNSDSFKMARIKKRIGDFTLPSEFKKHHKHTYGAVAMARIWKNNPNKRSSPYEFYIIVNPLGSNHLDGEHTVIGRVIKGMDIAKKINSVEVDKSEWPKKDICMKVNIVK